MFQRVYFCFPPLFICIFPTIVLHCSCAISLLLIHLGMLSFHVILWKLVFSLLFNVFVNSEGIVCSGTQDNLNTLTRNKPNNG